MFRNNYVEMEKRRSKETRRRISEALRGEKVGAHEFQINSTDGEQLRAAARRPGKFKHQDLIDWWKDLKRLP